MRRFQARHGINVDGTVREQTFKALNVPADVRLAQLKLNLTRLRSVATSVGNRFVMCNIPAAQIEAIENGVAVSRHTAVVGKPDRPSPEINSRIMEINFNPYWTVPVSIVRRDLIPEMQTEPDYLTKNHIRIFDQKGRELQPTQINWQTEEAVNYQFKQDPGELNSLGSMRINFPNAHEVYMHDTPFKNLFGEDFRFHSSGCVRIQNVRELVYWLLRETPGWPRMEVDRVVKRGERKDTKLKCRGAAALGLCDRLGHRRRGRAVPRRYLWPRRAWDRGEFLVRLTPLRRKACPVAFPDCTFLTSMAFALYPSSPSSCFTLSLA